MENTLFIKDKEAIKILQKENKKLRLNNSKLSKELRNIKKKNVYCKVCHRHLGFKLSDGSYKIIEGSIQQGQGYKKPLLTFCSRKCVKREKELKASHKEES